MKIVFDFDGTIADTWEQMVDLVKEIRPDLGEREMEIFREKGAEEARKILKISLREILRVAVMVRKRQKGIIGGTKAFGGMKELIEKMRERKIEVGILSSNSKDNIEKWLKEKSMTVDWVRSELTVFGKDKAIKKIIGGEMIYVGDEVRDVEACKKVGVKMIAVDWGVNSRKALEEAGAEWVVSCPEEIGKIVGID